MQLNNLFSKLKVHPFELKVQSKQDFFATKKNNRRTKISGCSSEQLTPNHSIGGYTIHQTERFSHREASNKKELESTFGSENILCFNPKPLKRKMNQNRRQNNKLDGQSKEVFDQQTPVYSSCPVTQKVFSFNQIVEETKGCPQKPLDVNSITVKDFLILSKLGEGSYSQVFKVIDKRTGFLCALKVLQKWKMKELKVEQNVVRQIKINTFLDHPNITKIYSCFHDEANIYLICEYATDKNIFQIFSEPKLKLKKGMPSSRVSNIIFQLCNAVRFLHSNYVIHRDIKPQNVLLTMFDTLKLCDFGWSIYNPDKQMRSTICGTPLYLAPQLLSFDKYDQSVDVWAIGILTFQLMTQENPFKITSPDHLQRILYEQISFNGIRNKMAIDFISKALIKDPAKRTSIYELSNHPFLNSMKVTHQQ